MLPERNASSMPVDAFDAQRGRVVEYESDRGLGTLVSVDRTGRDGTAYLFHCTEIVDGNREIANGVDVTFRVGAVGPGRWEATDVRSIAGT